MSEATRRKGYRFDRVLIGTQDTLDSDFLNAIVHITGGQLNILRNLMEYAARRESFVSEYRDAYYLMPTDIEWSALESVVADLEGVLMGNINTIWGYKSHLKENIGDTLTSDGTYQSKAGPVPTGEIWIVEMITCRNLGGDRGVVQLIVEDGGVTSYVYSNPSPVAYIADVWTGKLTLRNGDYAGVVCNGCLDGDIIQASVWGYKMDIPT